MNRAVSTCGDFQLYAQGEFGCFSDWGEIAAWPTLKSVQERGEMIPGGEEAAAIRNASPPQRLVSAVKGEGGTVTLRLAGALDAASIGSLRPTVDDLLQRQDGVVVIDLHGLRLLDTTGVREVLRVFTAVNARGGTTLVEGAKEQPLALLKVLKLDELLIPEGR
jgi:anti-sigma B factor antagonist